MALALGMKIWGRDINHPSSFSANKIIRNLFIQYVPHTPLKYGLAAWEELILNMLNILTRGSFRRVRKIAKSDY
jgi:hypothetical protein